MEPRTLPDLSKRSTMALVNAAFLQRVQSDLTRRCRLVRGQSVLVAVSGGVDSMVLLHALAALASPNRWKICVAHLNHQLRGRTSNADEQFVRLAAESMGLRFVAGRADVKTLAQRSGISVEMAARKLRHEFLGRQARAQGISTIALAHHADDQVELFFLRLLRGTGSEGLAGMKWRSPSPVDPTLALVRPLLAFSKVELLQIARSEKIRFRTDATNASPDFLRNRIRRELLPLLRQCYQPALDQTVLRLMDIVGAEAEFIHGAAEQAGSGGGRRDFDSLPLALRRKILQQQLLRLNLTPDFELVEKLRLSVGTQISVGTGVCVVRDALGNISCREAADGAFNLAERVVTFSRPRGRLVFGGFAFAWQRAPMKRFKPPGKKPAVQAAAFREVFDADTVGDEIVLRHWRPGDRFQPSGFKSAAKLQDLFVNAKIPAARRRALVLAATKAGTIFWVPGLRIGEPFKVTAATRRLLAWRAWPPKIED
jgi:tRNA(Ile)-lysidine synthase